MMREKNMIVIGFNENKDAELLLKEFPSLTLSEKKHFDGSPTEYIVFGTIALQALSQVLELLIKYLELKKEIKSISIDGKRFDSIDDKQLESLLKSIDEDKDIKTK